MCRTYVCTKTYTKYGAFWWEETHNLTCICLLFGPCVTVFTPNLSIHADLEMRAQNVIAEAMVVERSKGEPQEFASHLQSVVWGAASVGGLIASFLSG